MENNIFAKNINALAQKDAGFAKRIAEYTPDDVPELVQENGFYNFKYKTLYLHNPKNPLAEAKEIFMQAQNNPVAIHFVYGMGLGYLFQVASANSQGTVILYEPDLNILKIAFSLVDFAAEILKPNVFITDNIEQAGDYIHRKSNTKNTPLLLSTSAYQKVKGFYALVEKLQRMVGTYSLDLKYTKEKFFPQLKMILGNIPNLVHEIPLCAIKDCYKGKTAVVVSAGPTLDRNIETIKKYRENMILFVVGTAMKTLAANGIKPDFLCIIESYDSSRQIEGLDLSDVNFITEPFSHPNLRKFRFKQIYSHISSNLSMNSFWSRLIGEDIKDYRTKGTVSYTAMNSARILGCSKIILVGQDLAYIEGQCYSKESAYKDLKCRYNEVLKRYEITAADFDKFADAISNSPNAEVRCKVAKDRLERLNSALYYVKGINGEMLPTESVYAAFIQPLTEFALDFNDREYINTSLCGAQIDGFKNISLEEALKDSQPVDNREITTDYKFNIPDIISKLNNNLVQLVEFSPKIEEGERLLRNFRNEMKRGVTPEALKLLKRLAINYTELDKNARDTLFDFMTIAERIDVDYVMKMTKEFTPDTLNNYAEKMGIFYKKAAEKTSIIRNLINKTITELEKIIQ